MQHKPSWKDAWNMITGPLNKWVFFFLLLSGAPDEPRERAKAVLRPHQAPPHLSAVLRRQLQRHTEEIQEHGGAGLRLPLTSAFAGSGVELKKHARWHSPIHIYIKCSGDDYKNGHFVKPVSLRARLRARRWSVHTVELRARMNRKCCFFLWKKISCFLNLLIAHYPTEDAWCCHNNEIQQYLHLVSFLMAILTQSYQINETGVRGLGFPSSFLFSEAIFSLLKYETDCTNIATGYIGTCTALNIFYVNICQNHTELIHQTDSLRDACCGRTVFFFSPAPQGEKKGFIPQTHHKWHFPCCRFLQTTQQVMPEQLLATFTFL